MKQNILFILTITPAILFAQGKSNNKKFHEKKFTQPQKEKFEPINLWFVMLIKGPNREQDSATAQKLQDGHMANMTKMHNAGKLVTAGPFLDDANWRGIFILKCENKEEVEALVQQDPAIVAGRLSYEIHPWMTGKNCVFK